MRLISGSHAWDTKAHGSGDRGLTGAAVEIANLHGVGLLEKVYGRAMGPERWLVTGGGRIANRPQFNKLPRTPSRSGVLNSVSQVRKTFSGQGYRELLQKMSAPAGASD